MPITRNPNTTAPVFLTIVTRHRERHFDDALNRSYLLDVMRAEQQVRPFAMIAYVILPDHFHLLIRPAPNQSYVKIESSIKAYYTRHLRERLGVTGKVWLWQKSFYEHIVRDETDLAHHMDYVHFNPVKHGLVRRPEEWQSSSFVAWQRRGRYPPMWGWFVEDFIGNALKFDKEWE